VKIIELHPWEGESRKTPGTVLEVIKNRGIVIAGSDGNLLITRVQPAGKKIMTAHAFHLGARIDAGEAFTNGL
jgi:methionyl-tRNA formyltransferase